MTKRFITSGVALLGLLAVSAASAQASPFEFTAERSNFITEGAWTVRLETTDYINWGIRVFETTGNDGKLPDAHVQEITLTFYGTQNPKSTDFVNFSGIGDGGVVSSTDWDTSGSTTLRFERPETAGNGLWLLSSRADATPPGATGDDDFTGSFSLVNARANFVTFSLQDTNRQWFGQGFIDNPENPGTLAPEGSGAAALLPALLPIGLVALKRRKAKKEAAAA